MGIRKLDEPEPLAKMAIDILPDSILPDELTTGDTCKEKGLAHAGSLSRTRKHFQSRSTGQ